MKNKSKVIVVALIVLLLALAIGYAAFNQVLNISGSADAEGKFSVVFTNGTVTSPDHGDAKVSTDDPTKLNVSVKLTYPGDGCTVTAYIKNGGTVPAKLDGFKLYNKGTTTSFSNSEIEVLIPDNVSQEVLQPDESTSFSFTVKWKTSSIVEKANADFDIELLYSQSTTEFNG